jgi:hypothetical protein
MGEEREGYKIFMGTPEGKRPLRRLRQRWEDGIRMDLWETGWGCGVDSTGSVRKIIFKHVSTYISTFQKMITIS